MQEKVSIIIPVYNVEKYLDRCIKSVINQTYKNLEIILVDDGSTDNCPYICDQFAVKDDRIKVIHQVNQGLGFARNSGIRAATGSYISFVDSDDYIALDTYEKAINKILENGADLCVFSYLNKHDDGSEELKVNPLGDMLVEGTDVVDVVLLGMLGAEEGYARDTYIGMSVWKCIYSAKLIKEENICFPSEREFISEDIIFQLAILPKTTRVCIMTDTFYYYCENADTMSLTKKYSPEKFNMYKKLYFKELEILKGLDKYEIGKYRAARMFLGNIRVCVKQISNNTLLTQREKHQLVEDICEDKAVMDILEWYPWRKNLLKQKIFNSLLKGNHVKLLLTIAKKSG